MHSQLVTTLAGLAQKALPRATKYDVYTAAFHSAIKMIKELARRAFEARNYADALQLYLEALKLANPPSQQQQQQQQQQQSCPDPPEWAVLASNVAAVLMKLDRPEEALGYAAAAAQAAPGWPKPLYRQAAALTALQQHSMAVQLLQLLQELLPQDTPEAALITAKLSGTQSAAAAQEHHLRVQAELRASHAAWAATRASEAAGRQALLEQLQQGMAGYTWEPQDWEWRPTWTPSMRQSKPVSTAGSTGSSMACTPVNAEAVPTLPASDSVYGVSATQHIVATAHSTAPASSTCREPVAGVPSPAERLISSVAATVSDTSQQQQQYLQLLAGITLQLAELEGPKRGLLLSTDEPLLWFYKDSLQAAVRETGPNARVLVLSNGGGGVLGLLAAAAGAGSVVVVEKGRWGFRAAQQLLEVNKQQQGELVSKVQLVPVPLSRCLYTGGVHSTKSAGGAGDAAAAAVAEGQVQDMAGDSSAAAECDAVVHVVSPEQQQQQQQHAEQPGHAATAGIQGPLGGAAGAERFFLDGQADIIVTDLLDYSLLGQGLLPILQAAAAKGLVAPGALTVPSSITVQGQLVNTALTQQVSGFDLSPVNKYRWHPTIERIEDDRPKTFQAASDPVKLLSIDLSHCAAAAESSASTLDSSSSTQLHNACDALLLWFELHAQGGASVSTSSHMLRSSIGPQCRASNERYDSGGISRDSNSSDTACDSVSTSFGLGLYYLDSALAAAPATQQQQQQQQQQQKQKQQKQPQSSMAAATEAVIRTHVQQQLRLQFSATVGTPAQLTSKRPDSQAPQNHAPCQGGRHGSSSSSSSRPSACGYTWSPHDVPRHAMLPRWHFDMLGDEARNSAYDAAIRGAVAAQRQQLKLQQTHSYDASSGVHVLDIGTGTGLLSMMAVRAGADKVTAVESVRHLAETAHSIVALNGCANKINLLHKDGRYLSVEGQSSSSGKPMHHDMPRPADLLAFEVFDCGLIGEGALHIVAAARTQMLQHSCGRVLPGAAKVYCQPIQYNIQLAPALQGILDPRPLRSYAWQQDYFEVDLRHSRSTDTSSKNSTCSPHSSSNNGNSVAGSDPHWLPLAQPQLAFEFDFNCLDPLTAFQPAVQQLAFAVDAPGVCNAVAFWFELQLDEQTWLSSSPYSSAQQPGQQTTWKQAVQLLPEHRVWPGQRLGMIASHDTYAISFTITAATAAASLQPIPSSQPASCTTNSSSTLHLTTPSSAAVGADVDKGAMPHTPHTPAIPDAPQPTGVPLVDPIWKAAYDAVSALQASLAKAATQDPLEYRRLVSAALLLAMRPWGIEEAPAATASGSAGTAAASREKLQDLQALAGGMEESSRQGKDTAAKAPLGSVAGAAEADAAGSGTGSRQAAADPHYAAAFLVRMMS